MQISKEDKCRIPRCRQERYILYYGKPVCQTCWDKLSRKELRTKLGVEEEYKLMMDKMGFNRDD